SRTSDWRSQSYDNEGNLIGRVGTLQAWNYRYDNANRLVDAQRIKLRPDSPDDLVVQYAYDALGRKIARGAGRMPGAASPVARYAYAGADVAADLNGDGTLKVRYLSGPKVDTQLGTLAPGGDFRWFITDRQGSVRSVWSHVTASTNTGVTRMVEYDYDGFG